MKRLTCEMCGGTDLIKQDGVFVCQNCGTKYSVEEARKLMIEGTVQVEGTVDVKGTVNIDSTEEIKKLYQAARNAREASDYASAIRHYENISAHDPNSWEAIFYLKILRAHNITNGEIGTTAVSIANCIPLVFRLIAENEKDDTAKKAAVKDVIGQAYLSAAGLMSASLNFRNDLNSGKTVSVIASMLIGGVSGNLSAAQDVFSETGNRIEHMERCRQIISIMENCGDNIEKYFDIHDVVYMQYMEWTYKKCLELGNGILNKKEQAAFSSKIDRCSLPVKKTEYSDIAFEKVEKNDTSQEVEDGVSGNDETDEPDAWKNRIIGITICVIIIAIVFFYRSL